ncbi:exo-beta-N-acetylmuramidase NamZ domain-containing protein [Desulfosediminicola sp.]|uniref:exo-beta-N-acetylmuramidase NamZ family protein n=1 Tax=Desulfosediminicola sp. TaxID=2886825 RepID=UPI003AF31191
MVQIGLEKIIESPPEWLKKARIGLLSNQASTASDLVHSRFHLQKAFPGQMTCLFSPQHGFFAEKQDNMIESGHQVDPATGLMVYSLYGDSREPNEEQYAQIDVLLIDIVDVGTRVYTFMYTMAYCLEWAAKLGKKVVVLDRPNPVGGKAVEGNILEPEWASFVGLYPIPMRHGLTFGELALMMNQEFSLGADLEVIAMDGWKRDMFFRDTGFPWVFPSPNMPTPETALVYPGQVIWEGTNVSEGRGTTLPFELVGAPFWKCGEMLDAVKDIPLPGCYLRELAFEPTSGKFARQVCSGFQIHITDPSAFLPYRTSLALLQASFGLYPESFSYKEPPYEYEFTRLPMDLIIGSQAVRRALETDKALLEIEAEWRQELTQYDEMRQKYFLY